MNKKVSINVSNLDSDVNNPFDIRRIVAKMRREYTSTSLHPIFQNMDVAGVDPSELDLIVCATIMAKYVKEAGKRVHPVKTLPILLQDHDVVVKQCGIEFEKEGKKVEMGISLGMIDDGSRFSNIFGAASSLLSYVTVETDSGVRPSMPKTAESLGIPVPDLTRVRINATTGRAGFSEARDAIYQGMKDVEPDGVVLVDRIYSDVEVKQFSSVNVDLAKKMAPYHVKKNLKPPTGRIPAVRRVDYTPIDDIMVSWKLYFASMACRGGEKAGIGSNTIGYYNIDMPGPYVKTCSRVFELKGIAKATGISAFHFVRDDDFKIMTLTALVSNGITVIQDGLAAIQTEDVAGMYGASVSMSIDVVPSSYIPSPSMSAGNVIDWKDKEVKPIIDRYITASGPRRAMIMAPLIPYVIDLVISKAVTFYPTQMPHTGRCWIGSPGLFPDIKNIDINVIVSRIFTSNIARNAYPFTRQSYILLDPCRGVFPTSIILCKSVVFTKENTLETVLASIKEVKYKTENVKVDLSEFDPVEVEKVVINPQKVCENLVRSYFRSDPSHSDAYAQVGYWMGSKVFAEMPDSHGFLRKFFSEFPVLAEVYGRIQDGAPPRDVRPDVSHPVVAEEFNFDGLDVRPSIVSRSPPVSSQSASGSDSDRPVPSKRAQRAKKNKIKNKE